MCSFKFVVVILTAFTLTGVTVEQGLSTADGTWSNFEDTWGPCSRTCGGGVRVKRRFCKFGLRRNGCPGSDVIAEMCNTQACPGQTVDFRDQQCAATNNRPFGITRSLYEWQWDRRSKQSQQCELHCSASAPKIAVQRSAEVIDGTSCISTSSDWGYDVCVSGQCTHFGCDGLFDSQKHFDQCGLCGGGGNTCQRRSGNVTSGKYKEYMTFINISGPVTSLRVVDKNIFTIMAAKVNGRYVLNSDESDRKHMTGVYHKDGVDIRYERGSDEVIFVRRIPDHATLEVSVFQRYDDKVYGGVSPEISYEYFTPIPGSVNTLHRWEARPLTACSKNCGSGWQYTEAVCVDSGGKQVHPNNCDPVTRPSSVISCNNHDCPPSWEVTNCQASCNSQNWTCPAKCILRGAGNITKEVDSSLCPHTPHKCSPAWLAGPWTKCSTTCATGYRSRSVQCIDQTRGTPLEKIQCSGQPTPVTRSVCKERDCPTGSN